MTTLLDGAAPDAKHEVAAVEILIPIGHVHPDPFQPRLDCDAELADSIKSQGVLQAISVEPAQTLDAVCEHCGNAFAELAARGHYMINDGERRWRGSIAAKQTHILAKVIAPTEEGDRLERQLTSNTGKPLTPFEEAIAFKRLMEVKEWSQVELAKHLGRPRATIGDRLRLVDLHPGWIALIVAGKLQVSHAPAIHKYASMPAKYQEHVIERLSSKQLACGLGFDFGRGEPIRIDTFESRLQAAATPFIRPVSDLPGYKGATIELRDYNGARPYAIDPDVWKPIRAAQLKRAKEKRGPASNTDQRGPTRSQQYIDIENLAKAGVPVRETREHSPTAAKGEVQIFGGQGWAGGIDPTALLVSLDRSAIAIRKSTDKHSSGAIVVTTDVAAVEKARLAYLDALRAGARAACAKLAAKLRDDVVSANQVRGPGCVRFTGKLGDNDMAVLALGFALEAAVEVNQWGHIAVAINDNRVAERLLSLYAAAGSTRLDIPKMYEIRNKVAGNRQAVRFQLPEPTSKKQQKREARARGDQVGDPSRAAVATA